MPSADDRPRAVHEKPAETAYPILDLLRRRWSPAVFSTESVEPQKLRSLFEAARWGPSCYNEQPWNFVIGQRGTPEYQAIWSCLAPFNQNWTQYAPILGISVARLAFERNGKPNRHAYHDVGLAMGQLLVQAVALELSVHQMAGFDVTRAREILEIPETCDPVAAFAIGYTADPELAEEQQRSRDLGARSRKGQENFLFEGIWGRQWQG